MKSCKVSYSWAPALYIVNEFFSHSRVVSLIKRYLRLEQGVITLILCVFMPGATYPTLAALNLSILSVYVIWSIAEVSLCSLNRYQTSHAEGNHTIYSAFKFSFWPYKWIELISGNQYTYQFFCIERVFLCNYFLRLFVSDMAIGQNIWACWKLILFSRY